MRCHQCQLREATVHFSTLAWPSGHESKYLCENCCPSAQPSATITAAEPVVVGVEQVAREVTLRTRLRRKYAKHLFSEALDLAGRSIVAARIPPRSFGGQVRRNLLA